MTIKAAYSVTFDLCYFRTNVSIFKNTVKKLKVRYTFYQFRKFKQIISIKTTAFMLKITVYDCWRDANNYQYEENTPVSQDNSLFRAVFSYSEHIYRESVT